MNMAAKTWYFQTRASRKYTLFLILRCNLCCLFHAWFKDLKVSLYFDEGYGSSFIRSGVDPKLLLKFGNSSRKISFTSESECPLSLVLSSGFLCFRRSLRCLFYHWPSVCLICWCSYSWDSEVEIRSSFKHKSWCVRHLKIYFWCCC